MSEEIHEVNVPTMYPPIIEQLRQAVKELATRMLDNDAHGPSMELSHFKSRFPDIMA